MSRRELLRLDEREVISRELSRGSKARYIGILLGRHHLTIYDEINRNGGAVNYRAVDAQRRAEDNRARRKDRKLDAFPRLHDAVNEGLHQKWSPEQISKRLRKTTPMTRRCAPRTRPSMSVCTCRRGVGCGPSSRSPCGRAGHGVSPGPG